MKLVPVLRACKQAKRKEMSSDRLEVSVTYDAERGYVASAPELRQPVTALSLGDLRRRIEALMLPDDPVITLILDRTAERRRATLDLLRNLEAAWPPTQRW
jgi:hypothetical protein